MSGTIPTIVDYGIRLLSPNWFYAAVAIICAITGAVTGSSWTTAGTLGVAFVGMAHIIGVSPEDHRRCGDLGRLLRRQDVPTVRDDDPGAQSGRRWRDHRSAYSGDDLDRRAVVRHFAGDLPDHQPDAKPYQARTSEVDQARAILGQTFNISIINLLPLVLLIFFSIRKFPAFLSIFLTTLFSGDPGRVSRSTIS